jgi:hypothetical protein
MSDEDNASDLARKSVENTLHLVFSGKGYSVLGSGVSASDQSTARAVQSIGQTTAIVIQDAAEMLSNTNTVEVTAIGSATARWIATRDPVYQEIIQNCMKVMQDAAALYLTIATNAHQALNEFKS